MDPPTWNPEEWRNILSQSPEPQGGDKDDNGDRDEDNGDGGSEADDKDEVTMMRMTVEGVMVTVMKTIMTQMMLATGVIRVMSTRWWWWWNVGSAFGNKEKHGGGADNDNENDNEDNGNGGDGHHKNDYDNKDGGGDGDIDDNDAAGGDCVGIKTIIMAMILMMMAEII